MQIALIIVALLVCGVLGAVAAGTQGRSGFGLALGLLLGPLGVIAAAVLQPTMDVRIEHERKLAELRRLEAARERAMRNPTPSDLVPHLHVIEVEVQALESARRAGTLSEDQCHHRVKGLRAVGDALRRPAEPPAPTKAPAPDA